MASSSLVSSEEFKLFKQSIQRKSCVILQKPWQYYQSGPKTGAPLICLHSSTGTAESFFRQMNSLSCRGYSVISPTLPAIFSVDEFIKSFELFLAHLNCRKIHLFGVGLGGFLSQAIAAAKPTLVLSMILCNSFCDTQFFVNHKNPLMNAMPAFALRRKFLANFPLDEVLPEIADSADFVVQFLHTLDRSTLLSRYSLHTTPHVVPKLQLDDSKITILDACDVSSLPADVRNEVYKRYPQAKRATIKKGGEFVILANSDEVSMFTQIHLRNYEASLCNE
ncbi:hypothetical protein GEMRC1_012315 [Eukaryota sp. GEM-RC1]